VNSAAGLIWPHPYPSPARPYPLRELGKAFHTRESFPPPCPNPTPLRKADLNDHSDETWASAAMRKRLKRAS
jgi:hypothetical protein